MEPTEEPSNLFEELKQIRIKKGLGLNDISKESRIQLAYLEAIEDGSFENIPAVYDKFFFQTYLNYLEIDDSDRYMQAFKDIRKQTYSPTPQTTLQKISIHHEKSGSIFNLNVLYWAVPIIIILAIVAFLVWNSKGGDLLSNTAVNELPVRQIIKEMEGKAKKTIKGQVNPLENKTDPTIIVHVNILEKTWLRLITDTKDTSEYLLQAGKQMQFKADSVMSFLIGNASGLDFTVNGKPVGVLGKADEVISLLKITKAGIVTNEKKSIKKGASNDSLSAH